MTTPASTIDPEPAHGARGAIVAGARVGQYVVLRELGRGATATVYEAEHAALGKRVALKAMHAHLAADETASSRFLREGRAAAQVRSPHVVDIFDVGIHDPVPYIVMELLAGDDLAAVLRERGKLALGRLVDLMLQIGSAVDAAHRVGVIHRDLKPSNIVLARRAAAEVAPVVLDFGISKVVSDAEGDLTRSDALLGTVHYLSPEQTRGGRNASPRSDQYALGVMLYECATGSRPFAGTTPYALMHAIVSGRAPPPSALEPTLPAAFDAVVQRAMHRDPNRRYPSVRELGAALLPWASDAARKRWTEEFGVSPATARRPLRLRTALAACALGALVVVASLVALGARTTRDSGRREATVAAVAPATPAPASAEATTAAPEPPDPAPTGPADPATTSPSPRRAPATAPAARAQPASPAPVAAPATSTERGTNGALILE